MLNLANETLNQMPFTIAPLVILAWFFRVFLGWDNRFSIACVNFIQKILSTITSISKYIVKIEINNQIMRSDHAL